MNEPTAPPPAMTLEEIARELRQLADAPLPDLFALPGRLRELADRIERGIELTGEFPAVTGGQPETPRPPLWRRLLWWLLP